jgi:hypothetical protein
MIGKEGHIRMTDTPDTFGLLWEFYQAGSEEEARQSLNKLSMLAYLYSDDSSDAENNSKIVLDRI